MSVTANLTTNVETITATIVVGDETIIVQVSAAARGPAGEAGEAGPNALTTATTTNLDGFISGNGTNISGATAAASTATPSTLVLRDGSGGASFGPLSALAGSGNQHSITSSAGTNIVGPLALSGSTGDTLTATYNAAITLNSTTGVNVNGGPLSLTQTWNDAAVTFTGLQVNVTDTASNAASLLMDLRVGGVSRASVRKDGRIFGDANTALSLSGGFLNFHSFGATTLTMGARTLTVGLAGTYTGEVSLQSSAGGSSLITSDAANTLAQRNGNAAQESRIYGTYTGATNFERLSLKYNAADTAFQIGTEKGSAGGVAQPLQFRTDSTTRMAITTAGSVGIGTTSPASKLDVDGSIKASGTIQTGGYLFANLPTSPTTGMRAYITDGADIPLFMANAAGGGSTVTPVFYNGTNWINA